MIIKPADQSSETATYVYQQKKSFGAPTELADVAFHRILDMILSGELKADELVSRRKLAAQFGMSYQPVSEAMHRLELEDILISAPRRGTRVAKFSLYEFWDIAQERLAIEHQAIWLACRYATDAELEALRPLAEAADLILNIPETIQNDQAFHHALTVCSHSQRLIRHQIKSELFRAKMLLCPEIEQFFGRDIYTALPGTIGEPRPDTGHLKLFDNIRARRVEKALASIDLHIVPVKLYRLAFPLGRQDKPSVSNNNPY